MTNDSFQILANTKKPMMINNQTKVDIRKVDANDPMLMPVIEETKAKAGQVTLFG